MSAPSSFFSLSSLLWDRRKEVLLDPLVELNGSSWADVSASTPSKTRRRRPLFERLRPSFWRNSFSGSRRNTIIESSAELPDRLPESWFDGQDPRPIFAVVIGIDKYPNLPHLRGAVNDANAFSDYVRSDLKVPAEKVIVLRNEQATRAGILRTFHSLRLKTHQQPRKGDSIILYYAGYAGPQETSISGIQTIVPWDYNGSPDNTVPAVTSLELIALLTEIKRTKGDHITFIFDAGGSSSCIYHHPTGAVSSRVATLASGAADISSPLLERDVISGNLFIVSAYSPGEAAREVRGHGLFTAALIKLLKQEGSTNMTRANLLARLPQITGQTPVAYVEITDCPMFDTGLVPPEHVAYPLAEDKLQYIVHAGALAGVSPGSRFFVYRARARLAKKKPKVFVADGVSLFTTTLRPFFHSEAPHKPLLKLPAAIPYGSGQRHDLVVHIPLKDALSPLYQVLLRLLHNKPATHPYLFLFTEDQAKADLAVDVSVNDAGAMFLAVSILDERVASHGYKQVPMRIPLLNEEIEQFFLKAAHFYRHLNRSKPNDAIGRVSIEMVKTVTSGPPNRRRRQRYPNAANILAHGVVDVAVRSNEPNDYGFKITNSADRDLYPHILYFDNSKLSITDHYPHDQVVSPVPGRGGVLTIGYDNPGTAAFTYFIPAGQDMDVGFVKVLLTTTPLDLRAIIRPIDFREVDGDESKQAGWGHLEGTLGFESSEAQSVEKDAVGLWGTLMFCVVQRQSGSRVA